MDLRDLARALVAFDSLSARQWVADADRAQLSWASVPWPADLTVVELAVAAGIAEMLADRRGQPAPDWTATVPALSSALFLVRAAEVLPRLRRMCESESPEPLRKRGIFAPPDFLTAA